MNSYSRFINESFRIITRILPSNGNKLYTFANGEGSDSQGTNEFACLENHKAIMFYGLFVSNAEYFKIDPVSLILKRSKIYPDNVSIVHSCYEKNMRRWLNGQKSRKALNRAEYVLLVYCWSIDWYGKGYQDQSHLKCRKELSDLCRAILKTTDTDIDLLSLLWSASRKAYKDSYAVASK